MRHLALFNGIGGFQLAAHWAGWKNVAHVEIDPWCNSKVALLFPESECFGNIKEFNGKPFRKRIEIITGGDPCQPHSYAGLGRGKEDHRFLWPSMFRIIREVRCPWVINENVAGSITNGIVDLKVNDLESQGYTCRVYDIPAEAVGAFHQRARVWIVAFNPNSHRRYQDTRSQKTRSGITPSLGEKRFEVQRIGEPVDLRLTLTDPDRERLQKFDLSTLSTAQEERVSRYFGFGSHAYGNIPKDILESGIIRMLDGLPQGMDYTERNKRLKGLGNAIVPQVAYEIMRGIDEIHKTLLL